ncbi:hypothetical protein HaLaN_24223 [Haematococcus lacustris]|uniref:Uncharacterized protein n=1 Tax=Haematococcus lacustris TaxID=44745 RepID=A0A699ZVZ7_HAELA|nr:hypothetical protein HaLaN_24223 [Haematococcus lacustris]
MSVAGWGPATRQTAGAGCTLFGPSAAHRTNRRPHPCRDEKPMAGVTTWQSRSLQDKGAGLWQYGHPVTLKPRSRISASRPAHIDCHGAGVTTRTGVTSAQMHVIRCYSLRSASRRPCRMQTGRSTRGGCARPRRTRARTKSAGRHVVQVLEGIWRNAHVSGARYKGASSLHT